MLADTAILHRIINYDSCSLGFFTLMDQLITSQKAQLPTFCCTEFYSALRLPHRVR